jgi:hypothetical protein
MLSAAQWRDGSVPMFVSELSALGAAMGTLLGKPSQSESPAGTGHAGSAWDGLGQLGQLSEALATPSPSMSSVNGPCNPPLFRGWLLPAFKSAMP